MTIIGNILLSIAAVVYMLLLSGAYGPKPSNAGDAVGGYAMSVILFSLAFGVFMTLAAFVIAWKGGFAWVAAGGSARFVLVAGGLLSILIISALSTVFRFEPASQLPFALRHLTGFAPALFPLTLLAAGFVLLNEPLRTAVPVAVYKIPLGILFGISTLACLGLLIQWIGYQNQQVAERIEEIHQHEEQNHTRHLQDIENADPETGILGLLSLTGRYHNADVREKAVAKIKSNPRWQQELVRILESGHYYRVYTFLDAEAVEDKALFAAPLNRSISRMAGEISAFIQTNNHLNDWHFDYLSVERMLSSVEQFQNTEEDFLPAVRAVRAAFDASPIAHVKKPKFKEPAILDRWIKAHS